MKVFIALVCLMVAVVAVQSVEPEVDCDVSSNENGWAVLLPNPVDCTTYYVCDDGLPVLMQCPEPLHFNPNIPGCDYADQANCNVGT